MIKMPLGIPQPSTRFGGYDPLTQEAPLRTLDGDTEEVGQYVVDYYHEFASDTYTYGSPNFPRQTFPDSSVGTPIPAGSVITLVGENPYNGNGQIYFYALGTAASPVWVRGSDADNLASYRKKIYVKGSYAYFEYCNLGIDAEGRRMDIAFSSHASSTAHHCMARRCSGTGGGVDRGNGSVLGTVGENSTNRFNDIIYYDNNFSGFGQWDLGLENDYHALTASTNVDYVWFIYNTAYHMGGDGVQVGTASTPDDNRATHLYIGGNNFYENGENGIDVKECDDLIISTNNVYDYDPTITSDGGKCVVIHNNPTNVWIINNKISNGGYGIFCSGQEDIYILGNVIEGMDKKVSDPVNTATGYGIGYGISFWDGLSGMIAQNVLHDNLRHLNFVGGGTGGIISNNNILSERKIAEEWDIFTESAQMRTAGLVNNNVFYGQYGLNIKYATAETDLSNLPTFIDCQTTDPLLDLTNTASRFTISDASPAVDAGIDMTAVYALFTTSFGTSIDSDRWDYLRDQGLSIDIGANERGGLFGAVMPNSADNLKVNAGTGALEWDLNSLNETSIKVYKDDVEIADLATGTTAHAVAGISANINNYHVNVSNVSGDITSTAIVSDIMSVAPVVGDLSQALNDAKTYVAVRPYLGSTAGGMSITEPQYGGVSYGIDSTKVVFTKAAIEVGDGFNYVTNDIGSITGSVDGAGTCDITIALNSYSGNSTSRIDVNDTYTTMSCAEGDLAKYKVSVGVTALTPYIVTPVTVSPKHSTGIVSLLEV